MADCIAVETGAVLAIAVGLWACGAVVGAIIAGITSSILTTRTIYRKGQQWRLQQQEAEEAKE